MAGRDVELNSRNMRALLRSEEVRRDLASRAAAIAGAAGPGHEHSSTTGHTVALAMVWTGTADARRSEATDRTLTRAIDAGR